MHWSLAAAIGILLASSAAAAPAPATTPEAWRAAAAQDLGAIHDILRDNAPAMVVKGEDADRFRAWLEKGLADARANLPKVKDGRGYYYLLRGYVVGFRDSHIQFGPTQDSGVDTRSLAWAGFVVGYRNGGYEVAYRAPGFPDAPPPRARLVSCDGQPAEAFAMTRDRYEGDLNLESGRYLTASPLLRDRGIPFVTRPTACAFRTADGVRDYQLDWRPYGPEQMQAVTLAFGRLQAPPKLGLAPWGSRRWWLTVPSLETGQDWKGFFDEVAAHLPEIRSADEVVIDLRGNGGGDSGFAVHLAHLLWGDAFVNAREPFLGPTVWRASKLNRDYWASVVERLAKDPNYPPEEQAELREILQGLDTAIARGEPTLKIGADTPGKRPVAGPNPMRSRVVLLTDYACNSACLDLMDEFTAMPNVVQAGTVTDADTIFMELTRVPQLPSGKGAFAFGHKAWIKRPRKSNVPYRPAPRLTWTGELSDEAGIKAWLATALKTG